MRARRTSVAVEVRPVREGTCDHASIGMARLPGLVAAAVLVAGCGIGEGGMGLPAQLPDESYPGVRQGVRGTLAVTPFGCIELRIDEGRWFVIWPAGSRLDDRVRLPDSQVVAEGDIVVGVGAFTPTAPLWARGGYWQNALGSCAPGEEAVLVLDSATVDPGG
jgi:hypothetical protein